MGTKESDAAQLAVEEARLLRDTLVESGWRIGADLEYEEIEGAGHNEAARAARFGQVLAYLFGKRQ